jgi:hypothetical protein
VWEGREYRRWEKQSWSLIFDGVKPLPLPGHKAKPYQKLVTMTASPISCISLPSHIFFLNLVKGNYNIEPSLSIY